MLGACFVAMLVPTLFRDPPIYDSLREITLEHDKAERAPRAASRQGE
jgi:CIC family chloride channel protein